MRRIYGLHDGSGEIRYVGLTKGTLAYRRRKHVERALLGDRTRRGEWLRSVITSGSEVVIEELEYGDWSPAECNERERHWIKHFRDAGNDLMNMTSGGAGTRDLPEVSRVKLAEAARRTHTGRKRPASTGQAISTALRVHYAEHPETAEKIAASKRGKPRSAEARRKLSETIRASRTVCMSCGKESSATGITRHQQATGHSRSYVIEQLSRADL